MLSREFEICFLVDLCVSMEEWFQNFKKNTIPTLQKIKKNNMWMTIRAAFIGYRNTLNSNPYEIIDFTENLQMLQEKLLGMKTSGGKGCKNLNVVYHYAHTLNWTANNKLIIHIGDSPNHGLKYHEENYEDIYPLKKDYHSPLELHVKRIAQDAIDLTLIKLTDDTDITYDIIEQTYMKYSNSPYNFNFYNTIGRSHNFIYDIEYDIHKLFRRAS